MVQKGFKITSQPLTPKDPSRPVVAKPTPQSEGRTALQQGTRTDNPRHHRAGVLEGSIGSGVGYRGPARDIPNHADKVSRTGFHDHMGTSKAGHKFPGRRV